MKILVLNGSPRQKSDTKVLLDAFLDGIRATGEHEIDVINVIQKRIGPCVGCFECWRRLDGYCVIRDDQNEILDKMREADAMITSFPLYGCGMPSHLKAVFDRMIPLSERRFGTKPNGKPKENAILNYRRKRFVVICGAGFPAKWLDFSAVREQCIHMMGVVRMLCVPQTPLLHVESAKEICAPLIEKFRRAGEEFGQTKHLCGQTAHALCTPMLSEEEYAAYAEAL